MGEPSDTADSDSASDDDTYKFRLYIAGASGNSTRAITNIKQICETHLSGRYLLEIIDVHQQKQLAESAQLIALPLLIKEAPWPERRLIGDLSDTEKVLTVLGITS